MRRQAQPVLPQSLPRDVQQAYGVPPAILTALPQNECFSEAELRGRTQSVAAIDSQFVQATLFTAG